MAWNRYPKRNKYRNVKVELGNQTFDSKKECNRWIFLMAEKKAGRIKSVERQVKYELVPKNSKFRSVSYICDFLVVDNLGKTKVVDVKSAITRKIGTYIIKKKLMFHKFGIEIEEV